MNCSLQPPRSGPPRRTLLLSLCTLGLALGTACGEPQLELPEEQPFEQGSAPSAGHHLLISLEEPGGRLLSRRANPAYRAPRVAVRERDPGRWWLQGAGGQTLAAGSFAWPHLRCTSPVPLQGRPAPEASHESSRPALLWLQIPDLPDARFLLLARREADGALQPAARLPLSVP